MGNIDSFGQTEPTFTEDPLTGVIRDGDAQGSSIGNMGDRFGNPFRFVASGLIATGAGSSVVADLAEGFEYLLVVTCSDDANLLVAADVDSADDMRIIVTSTNLIGVGDNPQSHRTVELSSANISSDQQGVAAAYVDFVSEKQINPTVDLTALIAYSTTTNDTAQLQLKGNGEISVSHTNGGDNSNGAFMLFWRELPSEGTPRFGNVVNVTP
jgi:hypothetical protein